MEEKDRLGDKLHDKEKAAEDLFIAQREEQIRRIKQQAAAQAAAGTGACPRDGSRLVATTDQGVRMEICPTCHGVWFDRRDLEAFHKAEGEAGVTRWIRSLLGR
ncbi:MAG TPA: zf-TFIIB domain-containing protein [Candidatus Binatia bacterium]|jgi:hypothetical protein